MKYNLSNKIFILIKTIFFLFIFSLKSYSDNLKINNDLVTLGEDEAKVKIKIFSSFTCPHCANFHFNIIPQIKKKYVDTGKVQLIFIDFPLDQAAFNVSKLLHCVEKNKQIIFMDNIYKSQNQWTNGSNIEDKAKAFLPFIGVPVYTEKLEEITAAEYQGFIFDKSNLQLHSCKRRS